MKNYPIVLAVMAGSFVVGACTDSANKADAQSSVADSGAVQGATHNAEQVKNLATFDDLDFNVYSGQKWDEFGRSHAEDILVHYPDGSTTSGLSAHLDKLKPQFAFAPDTRIKEHPIKLADGNFTSVSGIMEGTFTKPMDIGGGKVIQPTGKAFKLPMLTVGRWENGVMKEEWLYWDNQAFMNQIGLGQ